MAMTKRILTLLPFLALALVVAWLPLDSLAAAPATRQVTIRAGQFAFDPPVLRVNRGDRVIITLQAMDVVHGWYLDSYDVNARMLPGVSSRVDFVADRPGKFRYRCSVSCGNLHPFMVGEMVVSPNEGLLRSIGLILVAVAAALVYLRRFPPGDTAHG